jgi:hypothetical protein
MSFFLLHVIVSSTAYGAVRCGWIILHGGDLGV